MEYLHTYGPFDLPDKSDWLIVGSGPSLDTFDLDAVPGSTGIIALNSNIVRLPRADVAIISHFEDAIQSWMHLYKANRIYIANPLHVGYRCMKVDAMVLFNFEDLKTQFPGKVRFFEKEEIIEQFKWSPLALFGKHTVASYALSLLHLNGIKRVSSVGIDGGMGHAKKLYGIREYSDDKLIHVDYTNAVREFKATAKEFGITLQEGHVYAGV